MSLAESFRNSRGRLGPAVAALRRGGERVASAAAGDGSSGIAARSASRLRRYIPFIALAVAVVVAASIAGIAVAGGPSTRIVKADFVATPGLYKGNHVDVLGIPVGRIDSLRPTPRYVVVTMSVDSNVKLPADAHAVLMAPTVVADRFVELTPAYDGGPTLAEGATIPPSRTAIPASVDDVIGTLDKLAKDLGPNGVNRNGVLNTFLARLRNQLAGNGPALHSFLVNFSQAVHAIAVDSPELRSLFDNLGGLSSALASSSSQYRQFAGNFAAVTQTLAADREDVVSVLRDLGAFLGNLTSFIDANQAKLGASLQNLETFAKALDADQQALAKAYDLGPLTLQNLNNTIDLNAPGGPALRARYDPLHDTPQLFQTICGSTALRFLVVLATGIETNPLTVATPVDSICAVGNALTALTPPPGAAQGPDLSLNALVPGSS